MAGRPTASARAAKASRPVREQLASDLNDRYAKLLAVLDAALNATKKVPVSRDCLKCGCKHMEYATVQDVGSAIKAAEFFANQSLGRPGEDQSGKGGGDFMVSRYVVEPEELD